MTHLIPGIQSTTAALTAERTRLDVIAQNISNANTTRGLDGKAYRRQLVVFESALNEAQAGRGGIAMSGPRVSHIVKDNSPLRTLFDPNHPHADSTGVVRYPNVSVHEEMADLIAAGRTFEANLAVLKTGKQMTMQSLSIGRR